MKRILLPATLLTMLSSPAMGTPAGSPMSQTQAIEAIERAGGSVLRDEELPDKPVVEVDLSNTKVTEAGPAPLATFTQLRRLKLSKLRTLDLRQCWHISNASIVSLRQLRELLFLDVYRSGLSRGVEVESLYLALPDVEVNQRLRF